MIESDQNASNPLPEGRSGPQTLTEASAELRRARQALEQAAHEEARVADLGKAAAEKAAALQAEFAGRLGPGEVYREIGEQREIERIHARRRETEVQAAEMLRAVRWLLGRLALRDPAAKAALATFDGQSLKATVSDIDDVIGLLEDLAGPADSPGEHEAAAASEAVERQPLEKPAGTRQRERGPDLATSQRRVEFEDRLRSELGVISQAVTKGYTTIDRLRRDRPGFALWNILCEREQQALVSEAFRPRFYARSLTLRQFGLTSAETLKKDRQKLRRAAK